MSNTNKKDLYPREVDELLEKKEFKQAILLLKKSNSLNPGNRKIIKKLYSSIINYEIYKNNNTSSLNHKKTIIYKIIFISKIINKSKRLKITEKLWMKDPLNYFLVNEYLNTLCKNKKQKRGILLLESITEKINNEIWLFKYLGELYKEYNDIEKEFFTQESICKLLPENIQEKEKLTLLAKEMAMGITSNDPTESILLELKNNDHDINLHIQLIDTYVNIREFDKAINHLENYLSKVDNDRLQKKLFSIKEHKINFQIAKAEDDQEIDRIKELKIIHNELYLSKLFYNVQKNPEDLQLRFEYGKSLCDSKKWSEAIIQLEKSSFHHKRRIRSLVYQAEAHQNLNQDKLALEILETAKKEAVIPTEKKEIIKKIALLNQ